MTALIDPFLRRVTYLRVSVTDRCDLRCVYCMSEDMTFLPKAELLSLEELERVCTAFITAGVTKLRLTGGEPLVRRDIISLFNTLGKTARQRARGAHPDHKRHPAGTPCRIARTRWRPTRQCQPGYARPGALCPHHARRPHRQGASPAFSPPAPPACTSRSTPSPLRGENEDEFDDMLAWCGQHGLDFCLIETMPMGDIAADRSDQYLPLSLVRARLQCRWTLDDTGYRTGGPARYVTVRETGQRLGFITPMTHNFCEDCNRVRLTATGMLFMCLGQDDAADLRAPLRRGRGYERRHTSGHSAQAERP